MKQNRTKLTENWCESLSVQGFLVGWGYWVVWRGRYERDDEYENQWQIWK